jgi:hypothetical protein
MRRTDMSAQVQTAWLVVFILGMFLGSNLGVLLMCLLQVSKRDFSVEAQPVQLTLGTER